jgi:hypothetical protein
MVGRVYPHTHVLVPVPWTPGVSPLNPVIALVGTGLGDVAPLAAHSRNCELMVVDWIRGVVIEPSDEAGFRIWLDRIIHGDSDSAI